MGTLAEVQSRVLHSLIPPARLKLSEWIEQNIRLPEGVSALPGAVRLWPYQVGIADAISDPMIERVTLVKPVRVGFTTLLTGAIGSFVANEPAPILALLPTESDARDYVVSDIEPIFAATPALRGALSADTEEGERNTLLHRRFAGGSLKIVAAKAPRNLRRHTARILIVDEADACESGPEGNPIRLAERRTMTFANRKIIIGSTPIFVDTSHVLRSYGESDARVFEVQCTSCGGFTEITWAEIEWRPSCPETAAFRCPACKNLIEEKYKASMVAAGRWRVTRPEVRGVSALAWVQAVDAGMSRPADRTLAPTASLDAVLAEIAALRAAVADMRVLLEKALQATPRREWVTTWEAAALAERTEQCVIGVGAAFMG
jgi:phage terminase large subunit GpA-like protein